MLSRSEQPGLPPPAQEAERVWQELQRELASRSTRASFVQASDSGHDIAVEQPELVVEAIAAVLREARE